MHQRDAYIMSSGMGVTDAIERFNAKSDIDKFIDTYLFPVVCDGDGWHLEYMLGWLARVAQGGRNERDLLLYGPSVCGIDSFVEFLADHVLGHERCCFEIPGDLETHLENKGLVFIDQVSFEPCCGELSSQLPNVMVWSGSHEQCGWQRPHYDIDCDSIRGSWWDGGWDGYWSMLHANYLDSAEFGSKFREFLSTSAPLGER